jgi:Spy/CpxP family protein refolding chaperone
MRQIVMMGCWVAIVSTSLDAALAQSPPPPPPVPAVDEVRIIERDFEFIGSRRGGPEVGIDTWEITPRMLSRLADELALTPAQQGKITEIMATYRPKMRAMREQLMNESRQLRDVAPAASDFDARSTAAADRVGALSADLVKQGSALRKQVWEVLTPEQRSRLEQRQDDMRERREERRERWQQQGGQNGAKWREKQGRDASQEKRRIIIREQMRDRRED